MLYVKGERRYTEANQSQILREASDTLLELGLKDDAIRIGAFSAWAEASEKGQLFAEIQRRQRSKEEMIPGVKVSPPRRGGEPA